MNAKKIYGVTDGKRLIAIPGANVTPGVAVVMDASEVVTAAARRAAEAHRKREARAGRKVERSKPKITLPKLKCLEGEIDT